MTVWNPTGENGPVVIYFLDTVSYAVEAGLELSAILLPQPVSGWHSTSITRFNLLLKVAYYSYSHLLEHWSKQNRCQLKEGSKLSTSLFADRLDYVAVTCHKAGALFPPFFPTDKLQNFLRPQATVQKNWLLNNASNFITMSTWYQTY